VPRELPLDHLCPWREEAEQLREQLTGLQGQMAALERYVFGKKAERLPSVEQQLRHEKAQQSEQSQKAAAAQVLPSRLVDGGASCLTDGHHRGRAVSFTSMMATDGGQQPGSAIGL